jgi:hypothetical protein
MTTPLMSKVMRPVAATRLSNWFLSFEELSLVAVIPKPMAWSMGACRRSRFVTWPVAGSRVSTTRRGRFAVSDRTVQVGEDRHPPPGGWDQDRRRQVHQPDGRRHPVQ